MLCTPVTFANGIQQALIGAAVGLLFILWCSYIYRRRLNGFVYPRWVQRRVDVGEMTLLWAPLIVIWWPVIKQFGASAQLLTGVFVLVILATHYLFRYLIEQGMPSFLLTLTWFAVAAGGVLNTSCIVSKDLWLYSFSSVAALGWTWIGHYWYVIKQEGLLFDEDLDE